LANELDNVGKACKIMGRSPEQSSALNNATNIELTEAHIRLLEKFGPEF
jgi:hypothetical protein